MTKKEEKTHTPMIEHFLSVKANYQDTILLYRMGDFYETFFRDAEIVAKELNIVLTARSSEGEKVPMAGIPYHALNNYLPKLINRSFKVAICEQMEQASPGKKLVRREVVRVITPGTIIENDFLSEKQNNYLAAVSRKGDAFGLAYVDLSTGEFRVTQISGKNSKDLVYSELSRLPVSECLLPSSNPDNVSELSRNEWQDLIPDTIRITWFSELAFVTATSQKKIIEHFKVKSLEGFGIQQSPLLINAAGAILSYAEKTQMRALSQFNRISCYKLTDYLVIDHTTKRNLELFSTSRDNLYQGSLLSVIDQTKTAMGGRMIRNWLLNPLLSRELINRRLDAVEEFTEKNLLRLELRDKLTNIRDIERLVSRISIGLCSARDMKALAISINTLPEISLLLKKNESRTINGLKEVAPELIALGKKIEEMIVDNPPISITEGGLIKEKVNQDLDELRELLHDDKSWLMAFEAREREDTGIRNLKVSFSKAFGYFIEISNSNRKLVPENYLRKQTLVNGERYITPELKERENAILSAEDKIKELEYKIFSTLRDEICGFVTILQNTAQELAFIDVIANLAEIALRNKYIRPVLTAEQTLFVDDGRHPVIENILPHGEFVANHVSLDTKESSLIILTGPNMSGKSTFMRQNALIVIMAQIGSFVPASRAIIGICDRIFTRVGAVDDLSTGQSTFMVEMNETANILNNATINSLILLDEVGRGTSTHDGVSIAWAVSEYIVRNIGAKTIFATHYHELNKMEDKMTGVKNYQVAVQENQDRVIFLHKVIPGGADKSYGIEVARLAGLPKFVIERSKELMNEIEKRSKIQASLLKKSGIVSENTETKKSQLSFFAD